MILFQAIIKTLRPDAAWGKIDSGTTVFGVQQTGESSGERRPLSKHPPRLSLFDTIPSDFQEKNRRAHRRRPKQRADGLAKKI